MWGLTTISQLAFGEIQQRQALGVSQGGTTGLRLKMRPNGERCLAAGDTAV